MDSSEFEGRVLDTLERYRMLDTPGSRRARNIVVGLSGGADSVTLLRSLYRLRERLGVGIYAAHINHGIRGETALRDERFCVRLCDSLGVPVDVYRFDVPALAAERGIGLEECGRICRYEAFARTASRAGSAKTATAHTLSDSCETVLFNIARGCGLSGLTGIPPVRGDIIRPLIAMTREDIERYCAENGFEYMTDETNADTAYTRNLIRHEIIPAFRRINPDFAGAVGRMSEHVSGELGYIEEAADRLRKDSETPEGIDAARLRAAGKAISCRVIMDLIKEKTGKAPESRHVSLLWGFIDNGGAGAVELSKRYTARIVSDRLSVIETPAAAPEIIRWQLPLTEGETLLPDGRTVIITVCDKTDYDENVKNSVWLFKNALDYDIIQRNMLKERTVIRNRREGDRISLAGRHCTRKIKKLLCGAHIPAERRNDTALLEADGTVIWLEGFGPAEGFQPKASTRRVLYIAMT